MIVDSNDWKNIRVGSGDAFHGQILRDRYGRYKIWRKIIIDRLVYVVHKQI